MRILHVTPSFYPAVRWGGPIFSTKSLCDIAAADPKMEIEVLTTGAAGPGRGDDLEESGQSRRFEEGYTVRYCPRLAGHSISLSLFLTLPAAIRRADVVHLTGTYSFPTLPVLGLAKLFGRPLVWSPRGALQATEEWDAAPRKRLKRFFERAARVLKPKRAVLMVTAEEEAAASVKRLPNFSAIVLPNVVEIPEIYREETAADELRLVFLSRLHVKKGIELLLNALDELPETTVLDIYGEGDPDYVRQLKERASRFGDRVQFRGLVSGAEKSRAYAAGDIFVLPSYSENFGIVIAEALAHGVPVVTTDATPWQRLEEEGCGRSVPVTAADVVAAIAALAEEDLAAMGAKGRDWMRREFSADAIRGDLYATYSEVLQ